MSASGYDYITKHTSPNQSGDFRAESITIHWWGEPRNHRSGRIGGVVNWLCQSRAKASAHFVVSGVTREIACIVDLDHAAWHAASWTGNHRSIGIEMHPWDSSTPASQREADLDAAAYIVALCWHWRPKLKGTALKGHRDWHNTQCPGTYYARLDEIRRRALKIYPRVDPDNPGRLVGKPTPPTTGDDDMPSANEIWDADVIPRPNYGAKDDDNTTWVAKNVLRITSDLAYQARTAARNAERNSAAGLEIMRELAKANRPLTAAETEAAAKRGLESIITDDPEVTLTVKEDA